MQILSHFIAIRTQSQSADWKTPYYPYCTFITPQIDGMQLYVAVILDTEECVRFWQHPQSICLVVLVTAFSLRWILLHLTWTHQFSSRTLIATCIRLYGTMMQRTAFEIVPRRLVLLFVPLGLDGSGHFGLLKFEV